MSNEHIYSVLGTCRQAVSQYRARRATYLLCVDEAEATLGLQRRDHPGLGLVKAYGQIQPQGLGRDRFVEEMKRRGWALALKGNYTRTTRSDGFRFPNLIKGLIINDINLIWQSDTTYFRIKEEWFYLTFIIDVYSRLIIGHHADRTLRASANVATLKKALKRRAGHKLDQLTFHSDGGTQYRYGPFIDLLRGKGISSSMCRSATDNAYAEKLNDVVKNEYLKYRNASDLYSLGRILNSSVKNYNEKRHHGQLPIRCSPSAYEDWLVSPNGQMKRRPLLIRDGQGPASEWEPTACGHNLAHPVVRATKGISQIMPAHVILDYPTQDRQLVIPFN